MKRTRIILFFIIAFIMIATLRVYAAETTISIVGENEIQPGKTQKLTIEFNTDSDAIGVINGKLSYDSNIESIEVEQASGLNGWGITYNPNTKEFEALNAYGSKSGAIMQFSYKVKDSASGTASINLSNINIATITYTEKALEDVSKQVKITEKKTEANTLSKIEITTKPNKTKYNEGEKFDKSGMVVKATYSDGTSKKITDYTYTPNRALKTTDTEIKISYTEGGITKTVKQSISVIKKASIDENKDTDKDSSTNQDKEDNTVSKKPMPNTGIIGFTFISIIAILIIGIISYKKYIKYKKI